MNNPFDLANESAYRAWRDAKLAGYPRSVDELVVPLADPRHLSPVEVDALADRCARANMALYSAPHLPAADKSIPLQLGRQLGLTRLEGNYLADEDGLSSITPAGDDASGVRGDYIPYTHKPINWHTDGYYNALDRRILGMTLHCAQDAESGGENALLDHEVAYIQLRDVNPDYVAALMQPDAMTIPARMDEVALSPTRSPLPNPDGTTNQPTKPASGQVAGYLPHAGEGANVTPKSIDERGQTLSPTRSLTPTLSQSEREQTLGPNRLIARPEQSGPVFAVDRDQGFLYMRYTARTRSILWKADALTQAAARTLADILADSEYVLTARLRPGMGLVCNNVLHTRGGFLDSPGRRRLLYRGRYYDRLQFDLRPQ